MSNAVNEKVNGNDQIIPDITGVTIDRDEGEAGPFMIEAELGAVEFR